MKGTSIKDRGYRIISRNKTRELAKLLSKEGRFLLPMLEVIEQAEVAVDGVFDVKQHTGANNPPTVVFLSLG